MNTVEIIIREIDREPLVDACKHWNCKVSFSRYSKFELNAQIEYDNVADLFYLGISYNQIKKQFK